MGYSEFLLGVPNAPKPTLNEAINNLHDASALFVIGYTRNNATQAERATHVAMMAFDFIVGEIMRSRDRCKANSSYNNSSFKAEMDIAVAEMVRPVTETEHIALRVAGAGNGRLPTNCGTPISISAEMVLNKIKHRHPDYMNFRIQNGKHIFVICPVKTNGSGPDSVVEFDVEDFCERCRKIAAAL